MLRLAATYSDMWNAWLAWADNTPDAMPPLREAVDAVCEELGRDPATLARSVSVQIDFPDGQPNRDPGARPLMGTTEELAETLRGFAREGIDHIQVVFNPNTRASIARFAPVLSNLDKH
jgi:alkanesulfonate monooxygenase SsuD/methylene tetrahydromethanopterin reductase-like flavin-dependent oxidoreductase (luciferase family)